MDPLDNQTVTFILNANTLGKRIERGLLDAANTLHSVNRHVELYTLSLVEATAPGSHDISSIKRLYDMYEDKHSQFRGLWQKLVEASEESNPSEKSNPSKKSGPSGDRHLPLPKTEIGLPGGDSRGHRRVDRSAAAPNPTKLGHPNPESSGSGASISDPVSPVSPLFTVHSRLSSPVLSACRLCRPLRATSRDHLYCAARQTIG